MVPFFAYYYKCSEKQACFGWGRKKQQGFWVHQRDWHFMPFLRICGNKM